MAKLGWFHTPGREGDRDLETQMVGLEPLFAEVAGKTVLDVGCAEGLISIECAKAGALAVHGIEIVPGHVAVANGLAAGYPATFERANVNDYVPVRKYQVVLLLAILHKLKNPTAACKMLADACTDLCVIRLPPYGNVITDARSNNVPHDIGAAMAESGFVLETESRGPFNEWLGFYRRIEVEQAVADEAEYGEPLEPVYAPERVEANVVFANVDAAPADEAAEDEPAQPKRRRGRQRKADAE